MLFKYKERLKSNKTVIENFSYVSLLQIFILIAPLITYPYLVRVLGTDLYGRVISAQVLASYASIIILFGTDDVCAKYVSIYRENIEKLSEIVSNILCARLFLWIACFFLYLTIVLIIPHFRNEFWLYILTYGITLSDLLFPQYFFQGIERMKVSTLVSLAIKLLFICLVFIIVKDPEDYIFVPILYSIGFFLGGLFSLEYIKRILKIDFVRPNRSSMFFYLKESFSLFATNLICTVKDKLNYFIIGAFGMSNVVVYDLGVKLTALLSRPVTVISTVLFPRFAKSRNMKMIKPVLLFIFTVTVLLVILTNIFLPQISFFFLHEEVDLMPLRIFTLAPIFLSISSFVASNVFVAFGFNKYLLYSILVTTAAYVVLLMVIFFTHHMQSLMAFVILAVASYFVELLYRSLLSLRVAKNYYKQKDEK